MFYLCEVFFVEYGCCVTDGLVTGGDPQLGHSSKG